MQPIIRAPDVRELPALSELCMRSKAGWGYDADFMAACRKELTFVPGDLVSSRIAVAARGESVLGVAQVRMVDRDADLQKLFVEPSALRGGVGKALFDWAIDAARELGASRMIIDADPDAAPFKRRLGERDLGYSPSGSIAGRMVPTVG